LKTFKTKELLFVKDNTPYLPGMHLCHAKKKMGKKIAERGIEGMKEFLRDRIDMNELGKSSEAGINSRKRIFDRPSVFILFLVQVLTSLTCDHVVSFMQGTRAAGKEKRISSSSSAYCQGRCRLELSLLKSVFKKLSQFLCGRTLETWNGFDVLAVDGTGLDMPDTPENRKAYPPRGEKVKGTSMPQLNLTAVFELFSGGVVEWESGNKHWGEQSLWKKLMNRIRIAGTIILGDSYYCSYGNMATILKKGGHCIFPSERDKNIEKIRRLDKGDWLVRLRKPATRAQSWTKAQWDKFPAHIILRMIEVSIGSPGFRTRKVKLFTTLADPALYPADEIAALQKRRWDAELRFRDIKTAMGMNHLRCRTPEMIRKEITMFMTAYNLVRSMMLEAAQISGIQATRISFTSAAALTEEWMRIILQRKNCRSKREFMKTFFEILSENVLPFRPGRSEPRVVKRTEQRFPKMKKPRKSYPEHRKAA
jgi:hypothetical protein